MNEIGSRINELVNSLGITKVAFAQRISVDQSYITQLIKGKRTPSERLVASICREFNVSREWLETGEGEMFDTANSAELDRIAAQYSKDPTFRAILGVYAKLPDESRRIFEKMVIDLSAEIQRQRDPAAVTVEELEQNADQTEAGLTGTDVQIS